MNKNRIISIALFFVAIGLAWYLGYVIYQPIKRQKEIAVIEDKVIDKLIMIQSAQKEYFNANNEYAGKWEDLIAFVDTGIAYQVNITEKVIMRPIEERWKGDSILIIKDTIAAPTVMEKLFPKDKYPNFDSKKLGFIPDKDEKFKLEAGITKMGGVSVQVVHVMDPNPEDETREEFHKFPDRRNLQFGSMSKPTIEGNWVRTDK